MALLQANEDLISRGMKEFNALLNQQVFSEPPISEEDMVVIVGDWVKFYIGYYERQMVGEQEEQKRALEKLRQELHALSVPFLAKYKAFLKSL